jgi:pimeloyl-ACP methyl ester carboxylesterase
MKKPQITSIIEIVRVYIAVFIFLFSIPTSIYAADPPGIPEGWSEGYAYVSGIPIHYYQAASDKRVIVMVHGVTDKGLSLDYFDIGIRIRFQYMLDARGHSLSDPFTLSDDGDTMVKDVVGFVKTMGFEKPILMGAATVMRIGAEYPDLATASLIVCCLAYLPIRKKIAMPLQTKQRNQRKPKLNPKNYL